MYPAVSSPSGVWLAGSLVALLCATVGLAAELIGQQAPVRPSIERQSFGSTAGGEPVDLFIATNVHGMEVRFSNYGGVITSIRVPDREGRQANVVLAFDSLQNYLRSGNFSSLVGRYANRIAGAQFTIDGQLYEVTRNSGPNHIHGGPGGFGRVVWTAEPFAGESGSGAVLTYTSVDGEEGFPGTLQMRVTYTLTNENSLVIDYHGVTDKPTVVNLTHHAYFNLADDGGANVFDHEFTLHASHFLPAGEGLIPTGEIAPVRGTPFDFTRPMVLGARLDDGHPQLRPNTGYDHNWVLDHRGDGPALAARLYHPGTGRVMEVLTDKPGIQVYTGRRGGIALETQHFPDSPNRPNFPSPVIRPGEEYRSTTIFRFSVQP